MRIEFTSCLSRNRVQNASTRCGLLLLLLIVLTAAIGAVSQTVPYTVNDIEKMAKEGVGEHAFLESVKQHGIDFAPTLDVMAELKAKQVPDSVLKEIWAHIPQGRTPDYYRREGDRLLANGNYAEAVAYYQKILTQLPDDPDAKGRLEQANKLRQKAEQQTQLRAAQDDERPNLPYYRDQLNAHLQKSDCTHAFYYAHKIFFVEPDPFEKAAFEKVCGPYTLTLAEGTPVTLEFQRDLSGSSAHSGDKVDFRVVDPIEINGLLVVPKDSVAWGTVTKSEGGRKLSRVGQLKISIEGMLLADGEKCSLAAAESFLGKKKSKKATTGIVITSVLTVGLPVPFLIFSHGKDAKIAAGTKVTARVAVKMNLDPMQFVPSGPAPTVSATVLPTAVASGLSVISFQNQSETDADIRLLGPSPQSSTVHDGEAFAAHVTPGDYYVLVRYGKTPSDYLFGKAGPIAVTETNGQHSVIHITLRKPAANNPDAQKEFDKAK